MRFKITFKYGFDRFEFIVEQLPSDKSFDYYKITGHKVELIARNNAPVLRRKGLKHRKATWNFVSGHTYLKPGIGEDIFKEIAKYFEEN